MKGEMIRKKLPAVVLSLLLLSGCSGEEKIKVPFDNYHCVGKDVQEIVDILESTGFTNIELKAEETSMEAWEHEIARITIDYNAYFQKDDAWAADAEIVIEYYELSKEAKYKKEQREKEKEKPDPLRVEMNMTVDGEQGKPVFVFDTNLQDGTVLSVEVTSEDDYAFLVQEEVSVKSGIARTERITDGENPIEGIYSVRVAMLPSEQPENVLDRVGEKGEYLTGDFVEDTGSYRYVTASYDYINVPYDTVIETVQEATTIAFGENCELDYTDESIVIKTWGNGVAENATFAITGVQGSIDVWNSLVESTQRACIDIQNNLLKKCGYEDVKVTIVVLNDLNRENNLLIVTSGYTMYDYVNGIDLISDLAG